MRVQGSEADVVEFSRAEPVSGAGAVTTVVELGGQLYGMTVDEHLLSLATEAQDVSSVETGMGHGDLVVNQGGVYGATEDTLSGES